MVIQPSQWDSEKFPNARMASEWRSKRGAEFARRGCKHFVVVDLSSLSEPRNSHVGIVGYAEKAEQPIGFGAYQEPEWASQPRGGL